MLSRFSDAFKHTRNLYSNVKQELHVKVIVKLGFKLALSKLLNR